MDVSLHMHDVSDMQTSVFAGFGTLELGTGDSTALTIFARNPEDFDRLALFAQHLADKMREEFAKEVREG